MLLAIQVSLALFFLKNKQTKTDQLDFAGNTDSEGQTGAKDSVLLINTPIESLYLQTWGNTEGKQHWD